MSLYNPWTGKPLDSVRDAMPRAAGTTCDECGHEIICDCLQCGAPNCCPRCCDEAMEQDRQDRKKRSESP